MHRENHFSGAPTETPSGLLGSLRPVPPRKLGSMLEPPESCDAPGFRGGTALKSLAPSRGEPACPDLFPSTVRPSLNHASVSRHPQTERGRFAARSIGLNVLDAHADPASGPKGMVVTTIPHPSCTPSPASRPRVRGG